MTDGRIVPRVDIVAAARALVGTGFRLHGRRPATGLDCVGLVAIVLKSCGIMPEGQIIPCRYRMRGNDVAVFHKHLQAVGLIKVADNADSQPGDIVLVQAGVAQLHLMIATGEGHIHAHAGIRRVVEMPGELLWPISARWRVGR